MQPQPGCFFWFAGMVVLFLSTTFTYAIDTSDAIETLSNYQSSQNDLPQAVAAVAQLKQADASSLIPLLDGIAGAKPEAINWLAGAYGHIVRKTAKQDLLARKGDFLSYIQNTEKAPRARFLAFETLTAIDAQTAGQLKASFLTDPSDELRRMGVAVAIDEAAQAEGDSKKALLQKALTGASDKDQVDAIAKSLKTLDVEVDLHQHYGLITSWHVIGPFDNLEEKGFDVVYPPERSVDLNASHEGMHGTVSWAPLTTEDNYGTFDLAKLTEPHKGAIDYLFTEFTVSEGQPVEFRFGTPNAWKLWINGELVFAREEYHRSERFDQYRIPGTLKKGKNTILLKVCQNEQEQPWAQKWQVQFRITNPYGFAILPSDAPAGESN